MDKDTKWVLFVEDGCSVCEEIKRGIDLSLIHNLTVVDMSDPTADDLAEADFYDVVDYPALRKIPYEGEDWSGEESIGKMTAILKRLVHDGSKAKG